VREQAARLEAERERETAIRASEEAERAREEALQAGRVKDEFLQMVSHEFRTPLTTIKAASRVLLNGGESAEERREYLETISTECDRQIDMIINLLDISRLGESGGVDLKHERVELPSVLRACERIERPAAQAREQELGVEVKDNLPAVRGDAKALRRALCTVIENAIKYTPEGGHIRVSAELVSAEAVAVRIADNGRGIRPEDLPHIFEKFFRGEPPAATPPDSSTDGTPDDAVKPQTPGVGLGLYLAERLISALDGRIEVKSEPNRGSRFSVILPVWDDDLHARDEVDEYGFEEGTRE
ncbi:MAG TPA: HAMP domain-containing sensor histidine kinase, partial [Pyrinomonadaceae bacterium]|nr:HAMP domain-containing sensor histidine kinase [Pyrinomonadaceae bacterium]